MCCEELSGTPRGSLLGVQMQRNPPSQRFVPQEPNLVTQLKSCESVSDSHELRSLQPGPVLLFLLPSAYHRRPQTVHLRYWSAKARILGLQRVFRYVCLTLQPASRGQVLAASSSVRALSILATRRSQSCLLPTLLQSRLVQGRRRAC